MMTQRWNHSNRQEEKLRCHWDLQDDERSVADDVSDNHALWCCDICGAVTQQNCLCSDECDCASLVEDSVRTDARELHRRLVDWYMSKADDRSRDSLLEQTWRDAMVAAAAATPFDQEDRDVLYWSYFNLAHERGLLGPEQMHHLLSLCRDDFLGEDGKRHPPSDVIPACVFVTATRP
jgi:hypothetical protein